MGGVGDWLSDNFAQPLGDGLGRAGVPGFEDPDEVAAEMEKDKAFKEAAESLGGAQGGVDQRRQQNLQQSLSYFDPVKSLLGQMYGSQYGAGGAEFAKMFDGPPTPPPPGTVQNGGMPYDDPYGPNDPFRGSGHF